MRDPLPKQQSSYVKGETIFWAKISFRVSGMHVTSAEGFYVQSLSLQTELSFQQTTTTMQRRRRRQFFCLDFFIILTPFCAGKGNALFDSCSLFNCSIIVNFVLQMKISTIYSTYVKICICQQLLRIYLPKFNAKYYTTLPLRDGIVSTKNACNVVCCWHWISLIRLRLSITSIATQMTLLCEPSNKKLLFCRLLR